MQYFISFLEGIITFISPCLLPMLPVYLTYFAGNGKENRNVGVTLKNACGFVCGFTLVFLALGAFAGSIGMILKRYTMIVNLVTGGIVVLFGLNYTGVIRIGLLNKTIQKKSHKNKDFKFFSAVLFGMVFSIGWTPCVGAFLGSALMMASSKGSVLQGMVMLLLYSLGLGIPFLVSAVILDQLKGAITFIKSHYQVIQKVCGIFLCIIGVAMMTGWFGRLITFLA